MLAIPKTKSSYKIKQVINELKRADLSKVSSSYLENQAKFLFESYIHTSLLIPVRWGKLYRAIIYSEIPIKTNNLSYPPPHKAKLNRANFEGSSMFYCSGNPKATFFELEANAGDTVVISKWAPMSEILIFPLGYTTETFNRLGANRNCPNVIPEKERHSQELKPPNIHIINYFNEVFTRRVCFEHQYRLTAAIAREFLITRAECGIAYPTIKMCANAENFALTTSLVDSNLRLESAAWFKIDEIRNFQYTVSLLKCAEFTNADLCQEEISWHLPTQNEVGWWSLLS